MGQAVVPEQSNLAESSSDVRKPVDVERPQHEVKTHSLTGELKASLKTLLARHNGSTKHPDVIKVIDQLKELNPAKDNCASLPNFLGEFTALTSPNFPGRIKQEDGPSDLVQYTLGRLSFNIFQPHKLVCTLRSVRNPVSPTKIPGKEDRRTFTYPLILDITIHTPDGDLPATLVNEAVCYENTEVNNRLMVSFTGGTLMPADELKTDAEKLKLWAKTFEGAYTKADEERSYMGKIFQFILKLLLGLTVPTDDSLLEHSFHFDIKRSPTGYLDVLYLDDDLRITKGNRGTIVVVERNMQTAQ
mmetsp:Transcript_25723/g.39478  ORF Transcript_25723/g.39478 Transcript_25723/m.39478 type:complete len:302 (-) Transcript_25723:169-1074(-)|eukprot:CAMPEP_0117045786 /NCGR_PEP_ID=MMETSP0472-20121206/31677_1 /TAXON_ID=693140 ORGANISM="Tiarina fusus, Strain LIS" /NCGR_SAMPLE_ID=MMETSP0472 /ASSEMBLY_ACC=CAM_ASM_000603 /LENGTH=301 /DNA_ID=CAMNT_0004757925 /DNA_START=119 /DNA_END=1024 /DNA_ORIENTATION=+